MANVKFEPNDAGFQELMTSPEMQNVLEAEARKILGRLPRGYGMSTGIMENSRIGRRYKVTVGTRTKSAAKDNLKNNTLLKALGR